MNHQKDNFPAPLVRDHGHVPRKTSKTRGVKVTDDFSTAYWAISEIFKILVGTHVVSKHANFCDDPSMYAAMAPKIRGRRRFFPISFVSDGLWISVFLRTDAAGEIFRNLGKDVTVKPIVAETCSSHLIWTSPMSSVGSLNFAQKM